MDREGRGYLRPNKLQGIPNVGPEEYNMADLHLYDRDTLIKIVLWLDERNEENTHHLMKLDTPLEFDEKEISTLEKEIAVLRFENAALEKEIAEFRRLPSNDAIQQNRPSQEGKRTFKTTTG